MHPAKTPPVHFAFLRRVHFGPGLGEKAEDIMSRKLNSLQNTIYHLMKENYELKKASEEIEVIRSERDAAQIRLLDTGWNLNQANKRIAHFEKMCEAEAPPVDESAQVVARYVNIDCRWNRTC
ncbi:uncharacterized protein BT62DRAFT_208906 [Guyanagaster necrorhizus]|uniref:Uncharacterized protein n=1 Tax=Guyanagaster necrorhizus TaxID=856835 RepID=A0A9P7VQY1_9AGAR|nr:uncharacterized protein BT62DRAFT_208906 [Guyanagaster necrorhizus MCA 3950]KAG7445075.1 hypothetical protein BT62DRAFT_208906 [Guyanagaster necrorhizus MCA 3950]